MKRSILLSSLLLGGASILLSSSALQSAEVKTISVNEEPSDTLGTDEFNDSILGPQWKWNRKPRTDKYSLTEAEGWLRLYAFKPQVYDMLKRAGNTLTQRTALGSYNQATIRLDISHLANGQHAGLCHFTELYGSLGVMREEDKNYLELRHNDRIERGLLLEGDLLWIRSEWGKDGNSQFFYSMDGYHFIPWTTFQLSLDIENRIGIYNYNNENEEGYVDVDYFRYETR